MLALVATMSVRRGGARVTVRTWWQRYWALVRWYAWYWRERRRTADGAHEVPQEDAGVATEGRAQPGALSQARHPEYKTQTATQKGDDVVGARRKATRQDRRTLMSRPTVMA